MLVKTDGPTSVVLPQYCRNEPFSEFAFQINAAGLPEACSIPVPQLKEDVFTKVMESNRVYSHSELVSLLVDRADVKAGSARVKISRVVKTGGIVKNQGDGCYFSSSRIEVSQPELSNEQYLCYPPPPQTTETLFSPDVRDRSGIV